MKSENLQEHSSPSCSKSHNKQTTHYKLQPRKLNPNILHLNMAPFLSFVLTSTTPTATAEFPSATAPRSSIGSDIVFTLPYPPNHNYTGGIRNEAHPKIVDSSGAPPPPHGEGELPILPDASVLPRAINLIAADASSSNQTQTDADNSEAHSGAYGRTLLAIVLIAGGVLAVSLIGSAVWSIMRYRRREKAEKVQHWPGKQVSI